MYFKFLFENVNIGLYVVEKRLDLILVVDGFFLDFFVLFFWMFEIFIFFLVVDFFLFLFCFCFLLVFDFFLFLRFLFRRIVFGFL